MLTGFIVEPTIGEALAPWAEAAGVSPASAHSISVTAALVIATVVQMVVGELVPKNLAVAKPEETTLLLATPFRLLNTLWKPLIVALNATANGVVRAMGIEPRDELAAGHSLEELEVMIQSSRDQGAIPEDEFSLLVRSISFADKTAGDALVPRVGIVALRQTDSIAAMVDIARQTGHSRFPICATGLDDIVGVAHIKDAYPVPRSRRRDVSVAEIMTEPLFVPESKPLDDLLLEMRRERKQMAVVLDEFAGTAGIATLEDLLEEIVGDIEDEHDLEEQVDPAQPASGVHTVSGLLHPDELEEATGLTIPEGDYDTFAGFLLTLFDRIPNVGDHASFDGWEFKVTAMDRNRISEVLVVAPAPVAAEEPAP